MQTARGNIERYDIDAKLFDWGPRLGGGKRSESRS
jgi:hypothetical protein